MKDSKVDGHSFVSKEFDDIYFSKDDGIEETKFVFLNGNNVYERWQSNPTSEFKIGELGFGTGLNFFVTRSEWMRLERPPNVVFCSLEKYPLSDSVLKKMVTEFPGIETWEDQIIKAYQTFISSVNFQETTEKSFEWTYFHNLSNAKLTLKLRIGDVLDTLPHFESPLDCLYLDGFAPKKNPEMWTEEVMKTLRKLSTKGTSFATFTAAGFVKRNLESAGFRVHKQKGYGRKREMLVGQIEG